MDKLRQKLDRRRTVIGSSDSFAAGLAANVPLWRAPALFLTFIALAALQLWLFQSGHMTWAFRGNDYILGPFVGSEVVAIRIFMFSFFIAFSIFGAGRPKARLLLCLDLCLRFSLLCLMLDLGSVVLGVFTGAPFSLLVLQIMAGFAGIAVFVFVIVRRGAMPSPVPVIRGNQPHTLAMWRLAVAGLVATIVAVWAAVTPIGLFDDLRRLTLLGGIGPGVIMFLLVLFAQLYLMANLERPRRARPGFKAPLSVVVPAYNEQYDIGQSIQQIDIAAAHYKEAVEVIVVDNGSSDATAEIARGVLATCKAIEGRVISVEEPGKAHALNEGVLQARHEFIVRIDADTLVEEDTLTLAMENFADPRTGAVGGIPFPPGGAKFDPGRLIEVILKHGYYSVALGGIAGLVGIPGMFIIYRASALREVGKFAYAMNGEDTDISLRIAEAGYRTLIDRRVHVISAVPITFAHLREQRLRWFRSVYHVSARAHSLISAPNFSIRGKLVLPYMLLNTGRRAMMLPLVAFGLLEILVSSGSAALPTWQAAAAVLIGSPMIAAVIAIIVNAQFRAVLALPPYVLFRALRSWYTLESALSIPITSASTRIQIGRDPWPATPLPTPRGPEAV